MRNRALRLLHDFGWDLFLLLCLAALLLLGRQSVLAHPDLPARLLRAKDVVGLVSSSIGTVFLVLGAVLGYRTYLKGRAFAERVKLTLSAHPVRWMTEGDAPLLLHSVDLQVDNIGGRTLWSPDLNFRVLALEDDRSVAREARQAAFSAPRPTGSLGGIQPGETQVFHASFAVPRSVSVFRVLAELRTEGNQWLRALTLANTFAPDKEPPEGVEKSNVP